MRIVDYTEDDGWMYVVEVPDHARPESYKFGAYLGPFGIKDLPGLDKGQNKRLHNALASRRLINLQTLRGNGSVLYTTIKAVFPEKTGAEVKQIMRHIKNAYYQEAGLS